MVKKIGLVFLMIFTCFMLSSCKEEDINNGPFEVVFVNYDGSVLYKDIVNKGESAHYLGPEVERQAEQEGTKMHFYVFQGFDRNFSVVTQDMVVKPIFLDYYEAIVVVDEKTYDFSYKIMKSIVDHFGYISFLNDYNEETKTTTACWVYATRTGIVMVYSIDKQPGVYDDASSSRSVAITFTYGDIDLAYDYTYSSFDTDSLSSSYAEIYSGKSVSAKGTVNAKEFDSNAQVTFSTFKADEGVDRDLEVEKCSSMIDKAFKELATYAYFLDMRSFGLDYYYIEPAEETDLVDYKYERIDNDIYFGYYPMSVVDEKSSDDAFITYTILNAKAGQLPSRYYYCDWIPYGYFNSDNGNEYMWYKDIIFNGEKYRGVYFTSYRPSWNGEKAKTYQRTNEYYNGAIHWFKWEKIKWNILSEDNNKLLVVSELILDSQEFNDNKQEDMFEHGGSIGYANNYELSTIRKWLNEQFYETAFSDLQKSIILESNVDNSVSTTGYDNSKYICNNVNDKMFLLSLSEVNTYYNSSTDRIAKASDFAKCQGLGLNNDIGYYYTRSPFYKSDNYVSVIDASGNASYDYVDSTYRGIRPACLIQIDENN